MPRKLLIPAIILALFVGCSPRHPAAETFADPAEELAYLSSLSNPTVAQWKRLRELRKVQPPPTPVEPQAPSLDASEAVSSAIDKVSADIAAERKNDKSEYDWGFAEAQIGMDDAKAARLCRDIIRDYPGTTGAAKAAEALAKLEPAAPPVTSTPKR